LQTESEADVRADLATPANEKPSAILQEETINEIHERTDEEEYHEALARELKVKGKEFPTASEADVRADRVSVVRGWERWCGVEWSGLVCAI